MKMNDFEFIKHLGYEYNQARISPAGYGYTSYFIANWKAPVQENSHGVKFQNVYENVAVVVWVSAIGHWDHWTDFDGNYKNLDQVVKAYDIECERQYDQNMERGLI